MAMNRPVESPVHTHHTSPAHMGPYSEDAGGDQLRINAFDHDDVDVTFDPLSTNCQFPDTADLAVLGTLVFGGPTCDSIDVMIPDCHLVTLSLGPAVDMRDSMPSPNLDQALCSSSLAPTLGLQRREYWDEVNPLLAKWKNVNDTRCPECTRMIRVNMAVTSDW